MAQQLTNTWLSHKTRRNLFRSNHFFLDGKKSVCGQFNLWPEEEKFVKPIKFNELYIRKICKRCVQVCEMKGILYKI